MPFDRAGSPVFIEKELIMDEAECAVTRRDQTLDKLVLSHFDVTFVGNARWFLGYGIAFGS
jgi:hypothetical protein